MTERPITKKPAESHILPLIAITLLLTGFGLTIIYSSSGISAYHKFADSAFFFRKQLLAIFIGAIFFVSIIKIPFSWIDHLTLPSVLIATILLTLTLIEGFNYSANGAARWLRIGSFTFQPAEFTKLSIVLFLSRNIGRSGFNIRKFWSGIFPNIVVVAMASALLMKQPDFGSTALLFTLLFVMLFVAGLSYKYIAIALAFALTGVTAAIIQAPYRLERLVSFLDPWRHIQKSGFQIIQSYLGFHNGGLLGLGLGESRQKLYFLPEAHTDFILSVVGEELGLFGVLFVVASFFYLTYLGFKITSKQSQIQRQLLGFGLTSLIATQGAINMAVCMGILPTKGIPLPFLSYGASSTLMFFATIALLAKLDREAEAPLASAAPCESPLTTP